MYESQLEGALHVYVLILVHKRLKGSAVGAGALYVEVEQAVVLCSQVLGQLLEVSVVVRVGEGIRREAGAVRMKQGMSGSRPVTRGKKDSDGHAAAIAFDCRLDCLASCAKRVDNSPSGRYETATAVYSQVDGVIIFRHCCERVGYVLVRAAGATVANAFVVGDVVVYSDDHVLNFFYAK